MPARPWLWLVALVYGLAVTAAYLLLPDARLGLWALLGYGAVALTVIGIAVNRPRAAAGWYLIAAGMAAFITGDTLYFLAEGVDRAGAAPGAVAVLSYVAEYAFHIAGLSVLLHARIGKRDTGGLLDALIIAGGAAVLVWIFGVSPWLGQLVLSPAAVILVIAFPIGDLAGLALITRLWTLVGRSVLALWLLSAAQLGVLGSDLVFSVLVLNGEWSTGSVADLGWAAYLTGIAAAALHPSMRSVTQPATERPPAVSAWRLGLLAAASLVAPIVLLVQWERGMHAQEAFLAVSAAVMFLLTIARIASLMRRESSLYQRKQLFELLLRSTEAERLRIAGDLHDGPVQALTALAYTLHRVRRQLAQQQPEQTDRLLGDVEQGLLDQTCMLRQLMTDLRPPALESGEGLEEALRERLANLEAATTLLTRFDVRLGGRLPEQVETVVYRVAQECLTNVGKHARAGHVDVSLVRRGDVVELAVRDDGVGFEPADAVQLARRGHLGLVSMKERVNLAGGHLTIDSTPGRGTEVRAVVPLRVGDGEAGAGEVSGREVAGGA